MQRNVHLIGFAALAVQGFSFPAMAQPPELVWSNSGRPSNVEFCTRINEPSEPRRMHWDDNFLCSNEDFGFRWSFSGPVDGMRCTQVNEPSERPRFDWGDNYLCVPHSSTLLIDWSYSGRLAHFANCVQIRERSEPSRFDWHDNFLCFARDSDADGLADTWETDGFDADGDGDVDVDLPRFSLGPDHPLGPDQLGPDHKDLLIELDWMRGQGPSRADIQALKSAFDQAPVDAGGLDNPDGQPGIRIWIDTGNLADPTASEDGAGSGTCSDGVDNGGGDGPDGADTDCLVGDQLGGGNQIATRNDVSSLTTNFYAVKDIDPARTKIFRYGIASGRPTNNTGVSSGGNGARTLNDDTQSWLPDEWASRTVTITAGPGMNQTGNIVANTPTRLRVGSAWTTIPDEASSYSIELIGGRAQGGDFVDFNHDGGTIMHEIGHLLGLGHGGDSGVNCKPNYVSVMNYDIAIGIPQVGGGEILDFSPPRTAAGRSAAPLDPLQENSLDEPSILDRSDQTTRTVFVDGGMGCKRMTRLDRGFNFDGDVGNDPPFELGLSPVNLNTSAGAGCTNAGQPTGCTNAATNQTLRGFDDWSNIVLPFLQSEDREDGLADESLPLIEEMREQRRAIRTSDPALILRAMAPVAIAGWDVIEHRLYLANESRGPADDLRIVSQLADPVYMGPLPVNAGKKATMASSAASSRLSPGRKRRSFSGSDMSWLRYSRPWAAAAFRTKPSWRWAADPIPT